MVVVRVLEIECLPLHCNVNKRKREHNKNKQEEEISTIPKTNNKKNKNIVNKS